MFINKSKIKKLVATGLVLVTTGITSANAEMYKAKEDIDLKDVLMNVYGNDNYIVEVMKYNGLKTSLLYKDMIITIPEVDELRELVDPKTHFELDNINGIGFSYDNDNTLIGLYFNKVDGSIGYVNLLGRFNSNVNVNDMIFNFEDIDLSKINGYLINYSANGSNIIIRNKDGEYENIALNLVSKSNGVIDFNNPYFIKNDVIVDKVSYPGIIDGMIEFNDENDVFEGRRYDESKISGINLVFERNSFTSEFTNKLLGFDVNLGTNKSNFVNRTDYKYSDIHKNELVSTIQDIDFSSIKGISYANDGNKVYFIVPTVNGKYDKVYVDLIDKEYCKNNSTHDSLYTFDNYESDNLDIDDNGNVIGFYAKYYIRDFNVYIPQNVYISVINPSANYIYNNYNFADSNDDETVITVTVDNEIAGLGLKRVDGEYDYVGVSPKFNYDLFDLLNANHNSTTEKELVK